ncbi:MAG: hypothetical protein KDD56_05705 [Bdellovibrionales bacterium]|nr:hypothetical protein [Bdellovibrionales bacterium]
MPNRTVVSIVEDYILSSFKLGFSVKNKLVKYKLLARLRFLALGLCCIFSLSCGGGGGGNGFIGAAIVNLDASPHTVDTGDRTQISTDISEVHENGIIVKFRYPVGLTYVSDSSFLEVGSTRIDVGPSVNRGDGTYIYLVFFFDADIFRSQRQGRLTFELEARSEVLDGRVEVDPDVDDPNIDNDEEFDIDSPEFRAESDAFIEVLD